MKLNSIYLRDDTKTIFNTDPQKFSEEIKDHPWFMAVQFHPELKSKPFDPSPVFVSFVKAAIEKSRLI